MVENKEDKCEENCKVDLKDNLTGKNLIDLGKMIKIKDVYPGYEEIKRVHIDPKDLTNYFEFKMSVDEWGIYTEITPLQKVKK